jgi:hypothetical protein
MLKLLFAIGFAAGLSGCVVAPPYGYPAYGYAPGYYAAPSVSVGVGERGGWRWRLLRRSRTVVISGQARLWPSSYQPISRHRPH